MQIFVNNKSMQISEDISLDKLLEQMNIRKKCVAVFINGEQILQKQYSTLKLNALDRIKIFKPLSGG